LEEHLPHRRVAPVLRTLREKQIPIDLPFQIVHGDIAGNLLIHESLSPGVIDFTPYWCPRGFGEAVLVVDVVSWEGACLREMLAEIADIECGYQLVLRAATRRLLEVDFLHRHLGLPDSYLDQVDRYSELAQALAGLAPIE